MKVFDYSDGCKGELVGNVKLAGGLHGHSTRKGDKVYRIALAGAPSGWEWHSGADHLIRGERTKITPEQFGCEAICFCVGEWNDGWKWVVLGTNDWNGKACQTGGLTYTLTRVYPAGERIRDAAEHIAAYTPYAEWNNEAARQGEALGVRPGAILEAMEAPGFVEAATRKLRP